MDFGFELELVRVTLIALHPLSNHQILAFLRQILVNLLKFYFKVPSFFFSPTDPIYNTPERTCHCLASGWNF